MIRRVFGLLLFSSAMFVAPWMQTMSAEDIGDPLAGSSAEPCEMDIRSPGAVQFRGPYSRGYAARDNVRHRERVTLELRHDGGACEYRVSIETTDRGQPRMASGSDTLNFALIDGRDRRLSNGEPAIFTGYFSEGYGQTTLDFYIEVEPGQRVDAGDYLGELIVSIEDASEGMNELVGQTSLNVEATVPAFVNASIGDNPLAGKTNSKIDFGQFKRWQKEALRFSIDANTGYSISMESLNDGAMKHHVSDAEIAYQIRLDGRRISRDALTNADSVLNGFGFNIHDFEVEITSNINRAVAGYYSDQVTIVISAD